MSVEDHLKAAGEATFLTLLITWSITFVYNRDKLRANPLKNVLGYNNPCVGWDFPPANSVGLFGMILVSVLVWRYNVLDANRTAIKAAGAPLAFHHKFSLVANLLNAVSVTVLCLIFIAGPTDGAWGWHTVLFVQHIVFRYVACAANFLETYGGWARARADAPRSSFYYLLVFGLVSCCLPVMYLINFLTYDGPPPPLRCDLPVLVCGGDEATQCLSNADCPLAQTCGRAGPKNLRDPLVPWWLTMAFDYTWFACLALGTHFMPQDIPLRVRLDVPRGALADEPSWSASSEADLAAALRALDAKNQKSRPQHWFIRVPIQN